MTIKVLMADDEEIVRAGLRMILVLAAQVMQLVEAGDRPLDAPRALTKADVP